MGISGLSVVGRSGEPRQTPHTRRRNSRGKAFALGLAAILLVGAAGSVTAQQLTTVAVVDLNRVYTSFFRESQAVRDLDRLRSDIQTELDAYTTEIRLLQSQRIEAQNRGNAQEVLRLDQEIFGRSQFVRDFQRIKTEELQQRERSLTQSDSFLNQVRNAISFVAESQGFTVILNAADPNLIWWSFEVDITTQVLNHLRRAAN